MNPSGPRSFSRSVFDAHVVDLRRTGLFDGVRAIASDGMKALLDNPRSAAPWVGGPVFDELNELVFRLGGRAALRDLVCNAVHSGLVKVLEPLIQLSLKFLGGTPASLFSRADLLVAVNSRNVRMRWTPTSPVSGVMQVLCGEQVPPVTWIAWEGVFKSMLELAGATGTIGEARAAPDGRGCEIDLSWTVKGNG